MSETYQCVQVKVHWYELQHLHWLHALISGFVHSGQMRSYSANCI